MTSEFARTPDDLTPEWLSAVLGCAVRAVRTERIGVGYGLDGVLVRATLDGDGPRTIVAKWCASKDGEREARVLSEIAPRVDVSIPRLLGSWIGSDGALLLLEDMDPAVVGDVLVGVTREQAVALARAEAQLHAAFWERTETVAWLPEWDEWAGRVAVRVVDLLPRYLERDGDRIPPAAREIAMRLPRVLEADRATLRAAPWTVVHADLHAENVLFGEGGTPAILDWTDTGRGPAAVDVAHLLVEGMTIETRRSAGDAYLCAYADALARAGVSRDASQLRAEVACVHRVLFAAAILWSLGPHRPPPDVPRVAKIIQNLLDNTVAAVADALDEH